jgi:hypothetical protein
MRIVWLNKLTQKKLKIYIYIYTRPRFSLIGGTLIVFGRN